MARCFEPREIAAALELPDGHPGRRHLDACPRCRSRSIPLKPMIPISP